MLSSGKLAPAFKCTWKWEKIHVVTYVIYHANRMTSFLLSELPFQTKFPCENSRGRRRWQPKPLGVQSYRFLWMLYTTHLCGIECEALRGWRRAGELTCKCCIKWRPNRPSIAGRSCPKRNARQWGGWGLAPGRILLYMLVGLPVPRIGRVRRRGGGIDDELLEQGGGGCRVYRESTRCANETQLHLLP